MARDYSKEYRKVRTIRIGDHSFDKALRETLTMYAAEITEAIDEAGREAVEKLVKITRKTAPRDSGDFAKNITSRAIRRPSGTVYEWGVKAPHHRKTHLLVHGHPTANGDRVDGDPFLQDALEIVIPEYEKKVREAILDELHL